MTGCRQRQTKPWSPRRFSITSRRSSWPNPNGGGSAPGRRTSTPGNWSTFIPASTDTPRPSICAGIWQSKKRICRMRPSCSPTEKRSTRPARLEEAEKWLSKVRANDHEGSQHGPACHTVDAETALGSIALARGDINAAVRHLHASTNVETCCHNVTKGFPTSLATRLLAKGQSAAVAEFCETVLRNFTPHADYMEALLRGPGGSHAQIRVRRRGSARCHC